MSKMLRLRTIACLALVSASFLVLARPAVFPATAGTASCNGPVALLLGGGGVTGYAWEIGLLKGLEDEGVTFQQADLIVGTSAGALLAAQLAAGQSLDNLYDEIRRPRAGGTGSSPDIDLPYMLETTR